MAGLMGVAAVAHKLLGPIDPKHFEVVENKEEE